MLAGGSIAGGSAALIRPTRCRECCVAAPRGRLDLRSTSGNPALSDRRVAVGGNCPAVDHPGVTVGPDVDRAVPPTAVARRALAAAIAAAAPAGRAPGSSRAGEIAIEPRTERRKAVKFAAGNAPAVGNTPAEDERPAVAGRPAVGEGLAVGEGPVTGEGPVAGSPPGACRWMGVGRARAGELGPAGVELVSTEPREAVRSGEAATCPGRRSARTVGRTAESEAELWPARCATSPRFGFTGDNVPL